MKNITNKVEDTWEEDMNGGNRNPLKDQTGLAPNPTPINSDFTEYPKLTGLQDDVGRDHFSKDDFVTGNYHIKNRHINQYAVKALSQYALPESKTAPADRLRSILDYFAFLAQIETVSESDLAVVQRKFIRKNKTIGIGMLRIILRFLGDIEVAEVAEPDKGDELFQMCCGRSIFAFCYVLCK